MATLKGLVTATVVLLASAGILLARTALPNPETASLLLLGIGMIAVGTLVRLLSPRDGVEASAEHEHSLASGD